MPLMLSQSRLTPRQVVNRQLIRQVAIVLTLASLTTQSLSRFNSGRLARWI